MNDAEAVAKLDLFDRLMACAARWDADATLYLGRRAEWRRSRAIHLRSLAVGHYDDVAKWLGETGT